MTFIIGANRERVALMKCQGQSKAKSSLFNLPCNCIEKLLTSSVMNCKVHNNKNTGEEKNHNLNQYFTDKADLEMTLLNGPK